MQAKQPQRAARGGRVPQRCALLAIVCIALFLNACIGTPDTEEPQVDVLSAALYGLPSGGNKYWNFTSVGEFARKPGVVPVCWTLPAVQGKADVLAVTDKGDPDPMRGQVVTNSFADIAKWVQDAVENSWGRAAGLTFTGWDRVCAGNGMGDDKLNPGTLMFGFNSGFAYTDGDSRGRSSSHGSKLWLGANLAPRQSWVAVYAIHEVGHVLGFAHEKARPDNWQGTTPTVCTGSDETGPSPGGDLLTPKPDLTSDLCYDTRPTGLSPGDIMGAQLIYGMKPAGSFVGYSNRCAEFRGGVTAKRTPVTSVPCGASPTAFWLSWFNQITHSPDGGNTRWSWNISGGKVGADPTPLIAWPFSDVPNQKFPLDNMRWKALGDMCVTVDTPAAGQQLRIQPCGTAGKSERWTFFANGPNIQLTGTALCVSKKRNPSAVNDVLTLAACDFASPLQAFDFSKEHQIRDGSSNTCANVFGGRPDPGSVVGMWNGCDAVPANQNEQFHMTGHIVGLGQCAAWAGDKPVDGTAAQVRPCVAAPPAQWVEDPGKFWQPADPQDWDIYWP